jgi:hypothetical protein
VIKLILYTGVARSHDRIPISTRVKSMTFFVLLFHPYKCFYCFNKGGDASLGSHHLIKTTSNNNPSTEYYPEVR